jgi:nitrate/TMAO reductase-like tetraheme cytochrome c subunit
VSDDRSQYVWRNTLTIVGAWIAGVALIFILSLVFFDFVVATPSPYVGVLSFLVFPIIMTIGLAMMVLGFLRKHAQLARRHGDLSQLQYYPRIDFNDPRQQRWLLGGLVGVFIMVVFIGMMSYEGYHYTESTEFCGAVCHAVMHPEYTAHQYSPHARVECAECHVGAGVDHYVRAKLAGVRQVVAVATDSYPRPLPPALTVLRPSAETCEQCHWPKYFGEQLITKNRFKTDEQNTLTPVRMIVKTGGSRASLGPVYGIHSHMVGERKIEFIGTDEKFIEVPWVRVFDQRTGEENIYRSDGLPSDAPPPPGLRRTMDCLDCHNRAVHSYTPPADAADVALYGNEELRTLPFAKRQLIIALVEKYETREEGIVGVPAALEAYYRENYPDVVKEKEGALQALMAAGSEIYRRTVFPGMNVDWRSYPSNVGHMTAPGCFRCHAGDHVDGKGGKIVHECQSCHDFLVPSADGQGVVRSEEFVHPVELEGIHTDMRCDGCHTGGLMGEPTCEGCHSDAVELMAGTLAGFEPFEVEADAMDGLAECKECHDISAHMTSEALNVACQECHEGEDYAADGVIAAQRKEIDGLFAAVRATDAETQALLHRLREVGPLHNLEASRKILEQLASR